MSVFNDEDIIEEVIENKKNVKTKTGLNKHLKNI